jgi:hypothetical protein
MTGWQAIYLIGTIILIMGFYAWIIVEGCERRMRWLIEEYWSEEDDDEGQE